MTKLVLNTVTSGISIATINENFQKISDELQNKVLYRNNPVGEANTLVTDLDTNGKRIFNLPAPILASEAARLQDVQNAISGGSTANLVAFTPSGTISSTNVQAAIQEITTDLSAPTGAGLSGYSSAVAYAAGTVGAKLRGLDGIAYTTTNADANSKSVVNSLRDCTGVTGGTPGFVNAGLWHKTITGATETAFEWGVVSVLDNYSAAGENVAIYGQGNKRAVGPTWAGVFEARDVTGVANPTAGLIGIEVDAFGNGTDSGNNRVGIDIVIGRDNASGAIMEAGHGIRVGAFNGSLAEGRVIRAFATGIITFDCAFDSSLGTQSAAGVAFRMAVGHKLSFAATNDRTLFYSGGLLAYQVSGVTMHSVSDVGATDQAGALQIIGTQVLTSRRTGYTNAMSGTADRANAYDTSTITLEQLARRVKAIEDDLLTHGLIGS